MNLYIINKIFIAYYKSFQQFVIALDLNGFETALNELEMNVLVIPGSEQTAVNELEMNCWWFLVMTNPG